MINNNIILDKDCPRFLILSLVLIHVYFIVGAVRMSWIAATGALLISYLFYVHGK